MKDGSLYVAAEMRDATTDQFAFDGSRRRPDNPNTRTALDLMRMLLERGADPNQRFQGQFHSTHMPNTDRFDNTPFFRAAVAADVEALKVMIAHGATLDQVPPVEAEPERKPGDITVGGRRANPNAGRTPAMVAMNGGRGPAMTGGPAYIRDGAAPYREQGSRKPEEALALLLTAGANPNAKAPDGNSLLHQAARAGNLEMIRVLATAKVDFNQTNGDGLTALDIAEGKQSTSATGRGAPPPGGTAPRWARRHPAGCCEAAARAHGPAACSAFNRGGSCSVKKLLFAVSLLMLTALVSASGLQPAPQAQAPRPAPTPTPQVAQTTRPSQPAL